MNTNYKPSDYDVLRARARAQAAGIRVVGRGVRKMDGATIIYTTSSRPDRIHAVAVLSHALECDCEAGQHGRYCMHRVVTRDLLAAERAEAAKADEAKARRAAAKVRDTAPLARPAFSMWAAS